MVGLIDYLLVCVRLRACLLDYLMFVWLGGLVCSLVCSLLCCSVFVFKNISLLGCLLVCLLVGCVLGWLVVCLQVACFLVAC